MLGATDMRKAVNGLSMLVADHLDLDIFTGNFFVFCNRSRTIIKILYWERNGFCLWQKRLEKHRFAWPEQAEEVLEFSQRELRWLLDGLTPGQLKAHPDLYFEKLF
ncbi:IS66 family insertion sequence element accessory protein TnpB [Halodesulfovibrio aestuarii]|uniref:IS66 family insertion sequence element accessory protein TnpB n=1 Tax=Halodesulfovibrio aestuarii TaxID=126333 RepID=A0ABV4JWR2_9BACT|nr:IS66 family insertion sequence element accessory protein TnpB [Halodesulfovibrio aestuarii]